MNPRLFLIFLAASHSNTTEVERLHIRLAKSEFSY